MEGEVHEHVVKMTARQTRNGSAEKVNMRYAYAADGERTVAVDGLAERGAGVEGDGDDDVGEVSVQERDRVLHALHAIRELVLLFIRDEPAAPCKER
jgi:hypothetical protein